LVPSYHRDVDRLAELATSIERDPAEVAREARDLARIARNEHDWRSLSRAQAVLGRAWRLLGEIELAEPALVEAIDAANRADDDELAADAHLALAGVLSIAGRSAEAFAQLDQTERLGSKELCGSAELQRAVLCRLVGRIDEALVLFTRAVPRLRRQSRSLDLARVLSNRGVIRMNAGNVGAAIADFEEAEQLFTSVGQEFAAVQVHHNLGCAFSNLGDVPRALQVFDEVSTRFAALGHDASVPLLSRAEALLLGGLSADALTFSQDAARRLQAEGNRSAAAEALVAVASAARLEGDYATALDAAGRARDWFASDHSIGWERAAELEAMRAQHEMGDLDGAAIDRLQRLADELSTAGDVRSETDARCLATIAACSAGRLDLAGRQVVLARAAARRSRLWHTRLSSRHAMATYRLASGDVRGARRELLTALAALETSHQLGGAGDSGAAVVTQARAVTQLSVRVAAMETQPMRALAWMERSRIGNQFARPALPPTSTETAAEFARLRTAAGDLRRAELAGEPTADLRRKQAGLEASMRDEWLKTKPFETLPSTLPELGTLRDVLGDAVVVSIADDGNRLLAVVADRRNTRTCHLGPTSRALDLAQRAKAGLRGLTLPGSATSVIAARQRTFAAAVGALDSVLLEPLGLDAQRVILVVPAELHALPWAALPSLADRAFTLAPSVRWWIGAATSAHTTPASALVVAGPRLAEAEAEAKEVAACHRRATTLVGSQASTARVSLSMSRHDIVHIVAHGHFRHDNPLWSTIELSDGSLTVYELQRLGQVPPTIILASCDSGAGSARGGAQLHGLAGTLLAMGARTIVAAVGALPDTSETRRVMVDLHHDLACGTRAADSLAARHSTNDAGSSVTSAGLVTLGVG
jgi:tetratricopeptide (TPR) repeat protein